MRTNLSMLFLLSFAFSTPCIADETHSMEHGAQIFHAFNLDVGGGLSRNDGTANWDFDGWIGTDEHKLWLKSEGEYTNSKTEKSEFYALYSYNLSTFWDIQAGVRYDTQPNPLTYATLGFKGLAPYFLETTAHLFASEDGDISARLGQETDFLLTQRLIAQPYWEANLFAQDVHAQHKGSGLSTAEIGGQLRYEITRKFAPYIEVKYERKFGDTANFAERHGEQTDAVIGTLGLRLMF
ncbi:copper resistance protein B [Beggiatoa leptomitoformis]|uniref:Copper resistance protein B n=1 Tax=Beggiatoa leptomitoformis TaxID=288004 RepID=A0A2N9YAE2_9GAMM|nr:copper resistance protein B [Beggiatoa leptomitoformis]ALG67182.1 copper resistance protein B [Beggiatoa leptomitoformis]AUI67414.1 copper resistance protein B [Beggiatoa leptomitoformis]